jgi:hypothetical protein
MLGILVETRLFEVIDREEECRFRPVRVVIDGALAVGTVGGIGVGTMDGT